MPFTDEAFCAVFAGWNPAIWPLQLLALGAGLAVLGDLARPSRVAARAILGILAAHGLIAAGLAAAVLAVAGGAAGLRAPAGTAIDGRGRADGAAVGGWGGSEGRASPPAQRRCACPARYSSTGSSIRNGSVTVRSPAARISRASNWCGSAGAARLCNAW